MVLNIGTIFLLPISVMFIILIHSSYKIELSKNIRKGYSSGKKIVKLKRFLHLRRNRLTNIEIRYRSRERQSLFIVVVSVTFFLGMVYFESEGAKKGLETKDSISAGDYAKLILESHDEKNLSVVFCGARNCAATDGNGKIIYFPQNGHTVIQSNETQIAPPN
tara:strand:+ start:2153 stop:2641 length:489 start_codon:yes stop_codon:yes gene_type:complete